MRNYIFSAHVVYQACSLSLVPGNFCNPLKIENLLYVNIIVSGLDYFPFMIAFSILCEPRDGTSQAS